MAPTTPSPSARRPPRGVFACSTPTSSTLPAVWQVGTPVTVVHRLPPELDRVVAQQVGDPIGSAPADRSNASEAPSGRAAPLRLARGPGGGWPEVCQGSAWSLPDAKSRAGAGRPALRCAGLASTGGQPEGEACLLRPARLPVWPQDQAAAALGPQRTACFPCDLKFALLADRGIVRVAGADAKKLLQGSDHQRHGLLGTGPAIHAALLSPQGKILFEFFVVGPGEAYLARYGRGAGSQFVEAPSSISCAPRRRSASVCELTRVFAVWGAPAAGPVALPGAPPLPIPGWHNWACASSRKIAARAARRGRAGHSAGNGRRLASASHWPRRPGGGSGLSAGRHLPARGQLRPAERCIFQQRLLHRPGGGEPHAAPRRWAQALVRRGHGRLGSQRGDQGWHGVVGLIGSVDGSRALALVRLDRAAEALAAGAALTAELSPSASSSRLGPLRDGSDAPHGGGMTAGDLRALSLGRDRRSPNMRATTTRNGAYPRAMSARCLRSWCSRASNRACRG